METSVTCCGVYKGKAVPLHVKQAQGGGGDVTLSLLNLGNRKGWVVNITPRPLFPQERNPLLVIVRSWVDLGAGFDWSGKSRTPPDFEPRTDQLRAVYCSGCNDVYVNTYTFINRLSFPLCKYCVIKCMYFYVND